MLFEASITLFNTDSFLVQVNQYSILYAFVTFLHSLALYQFPITGIRCYFKIVYSQVKIQHI